jgi:hypothetical protein
MAQKAEMSLTMSSCTMAVPTELGKSPELRRTTEEQRAEWVPGTPTFVVKPAPANQSDYKLSGTHAT